MIPILEYIEEADPCHIVCMTVNIFIEGLLVWIFKSLKVLIMRISILIKPYLRYIFWFTYKQEIWVAIDI